MSTFQQNQSNGFSPILLSPSSTSNPTLTVGHFPFYDNSDQGSVDSDYTSLSSSKFYGHGGSTSSLHRQGRSQSIDELASTNVNTTTIPTRHFNGVSNVNKVNADPLQFVKIHPNHDLIERAQEQLTLAESRKRLQETFQLNTKTLTTSKSHSAIDDDETNWSKAVENWRQRREQKRKQSLSAVRVEDEATNSISNPETNPVEKNEPIETKVLSTSLKTKPSATTNVEFEAEKTNRLVSKSPSPQRIRGPSKIHEISIEKPLTMRGFGFKLEDGKSFNRPVFISTIEDGSPADKAGLSVDDEILAMNGENIERTSFDQVRKILKESNLHGNIQLLVRTFEEVFDDHSQTVTTGPTTDHSRTPSPQKSFSNLPTNCSTTNVLKNGDSSSICSPTKSAPTPPFIPSLSRFQPTLSNSFSLTNENPQISSTNSSLSIFAPKPFRPTNSLQFDSIHQSDSSTGLVEQPVINATQTKSPDSSTNKPLSNNDNNNNDENPVSLNIHESTTAIKLETNKPTPLTSVESLLHGSTKNENDRNEIIDESPISQVRSSVERQMNQLQQELLLGFPNVSNEEKREQRVVPIPIDLSNAALPKSALKKSTSQPTESNHFRTRSFEKLNQENSSNLNENPMKHFVNTKKLSNENPLSSSELRIQLSPPFSSQSQEKISVQSEQKIPQFRMTSKQLHTTLNQAPKRTSYEDRSWILNDSRPSTGNSSNFYNQPATQQNGNSRRAPPPVPPTTQVYRQTNNQLAMFHYGDNTEHFQNFHRQVEHQNDVQTSNNRPQTSKQQPKSPIRTTISSNNNRVLSVSGKLRCSRCTDELGQGSAMVIESLGLYYHIECFRCFVCNIPLSSSFEGTDVRVRENRLHCQNCFSDNHGAWRSNV